MACDSVVCVSCGEEIGWENCGFPFTFLRSLTLLWPSFCEFGATRSGSIETIEGLRESLSQVGDIHVRWRIARRSEGLVYKRTVSELRTQDAEGLQDLATNGGLEDDGENVGPRRIRCKTDHDCPSMWISKLN